MDIKIEQIDCIEGLKKLQDSSVDLIISDPPYILGKNYENQSDFGDRKEYMEFTNNWILESKRVLKDSGTIYVFMGVRLISDIFNMLEKNKFIFNSWITWHYTQGLGKKKGFSPRHDDILMFTKTKKFKFNLDAIRIPQKYYRSRNNMKGSNPGDVWRFSHVHYSNPNRQDHPTQKPEGVIERMILTSSNEGDIVVDPFSGSGTTLRVAQQLNRNAIGFEITKKYVEQTKARLKKSFEGFDSYDDRYLRVPNDLNDEKIREEYYKFHIEEFLKNDPNKVKRFKKDFYEKYKVKYE